MNKFFKILLWIVGGIAALLLLLIIGIQLFFPTEKARRYAEKEGSNVLGRPVTIASLDVSFWGGLGVLLKDVTITGGPETSFDTLMQAAEIDAKLQLWPLLSSEFRVDRFVISQPRIRMVTRKDGSNNYTFATLDTLVPPEAKQIPAEGRATAAAVSFDRLEINRGALYYRNDSTNLTLELTGFNLTTSLTLPRTDYYHSAGKLDADTIRITTDEPLPAYAIQVNYSAGYDPLRQDLTIERCDLSLNGLRLGLDGVVNKLLEAPQARLAVKTDRVDVVDLFALLPPSQRENLKDYAVTGNFSLTVDLEYNSLDTARPILYSGTAVIDKMAMSTDKIPGELKIGRALVDFKQDNLRLTLEKATFDNKPLKGNLVVDNFDDPAISGDLAGDVDLAFVQPFLPGETKQELTGRTQFQLTFSGLVSKPEEMDFSGDLSVVNGHYNSEMLPEPVDSFTVDVYFDRRLVNVRSLIGYFRSGQMSFTGRITNLVPYLLADSTMAKSVAPTADGRLSGRINMAMVNGLLPEKGAPEMTGIAELDLAIDGNMNELSKLRPRGSLSIANATYRDSLLPEPITFLAASLNLQPDTIRVDQLDVKFESSDIAFSGKLINPFPYLLPFDDIDRATVRRPMFLFTLSSQRFDVDKLFPEAVPGSQEAGASERALDSVSIVFVPDIDGQGTLAVDTLIYNKMEFTDATGQVKIRDRKIIVTEITSHLYTGLVSGETTIDLNDFENPIYTGKFTAKQIEADDFMSRFTPFGGYLFGKIDFDGTYNARGWEPDQFLNSLSMDGNALMREGTLKTSGAVYSALNTLSEAVHESIDPEQTIRTLASKVTVDSGRVRLDDVTSKLDKIGDITIGGFYGFDGGLQYKGSLLLSPPLTEKLLGKLGDLGGLLKPKSVDRMALPLVVGGTVDKPSVKLDMSAVTRSAGKNILEGVGDKLKGLLPKKDKPAPADTTKSGGN